MGQTVELLEEDQAEEDQVEEDQAEEDQVEEGQMYSEEEEFTREVGQIWVEDSEE